MTSRFAVVEFEIALEAFPNEDARNAWRGRKSAVRMLVETIIPR
jgi:hypothetical protein